MKLVSEERNKKIFVEDNKTYVVLNMGSYVGHRNRQWYSPKPEAWILMISDEKCEDGEILHIEALVDDQGNYMRFIMKKGDIRRAIQLHCGRVFSDIIWDSCSTYVCLDGDIYSDEQVPLEEYLTNEQEFSSDGKVFDGELASNSPLKDFLDSDKRLRKMLTNSSRR